MIGSGGCSGCGSDPVDVFESLPRYKLVYPDGSAQTAFTQAETAAKVAAFAPYGDVEVLELSSKQGEPIKYSKPAPKRISRKTEDDGNIDPDVV